MDIDGSNLLQLTTGKDFSPNISPDGRWVIFDSSSSPEGTGLWKVSIDGGNTERLTNYGAEAPSYSPDGRWIVCQARDDPKDPFNPRFRYVVIPASGGDPVARFDFPSGLLDYGGWGPDSSHLSFGATWLDDANVWLQPLAGGKPRKLTNFKSELTNLKSEKIFRHAWSRDGSTLALARARDMHDVVLMKNISF
jgi:Tol biopolymer transport system component